MSRIRRGREATNIDTMMERLGIDVGSRAAPRFGLLFSCTLRNCSCCTAYESCSRWLATKHEPLVGPPKFCPNFDLLSELFFDPDAGHARSRPGDLLGGRGRKGRVVGLLHLQGHAGVVRCESLASQSGWQ